MEPTRRNPFRRAARSDSQHLRTHPLGREDRASFSLEPKCTSDKKEGPIPKSEDGAFFFIRTLSLISFRRLGVPALTHRVKEPPQQFHAYACNIIGTFISPLWRCFACRCFRGKGKFDFLLWGRCRTGAGAISTIVRALPLRKSDAGLARWQALRGCGRVVS